MHSARWMAKAIYCLKVYMFREQFPILTEQNISGLLKMCIFVVDVYVRAWYDAPYAASAPRSDLQLAADLKRFASVDQNAAAIGLQKLQGQLWYLSEELIGLAVFDTGLPDEERESLVQSILGKQGEAERSTRRNLSIEELTSSSIAELGSTNTALFFEILGIEKDSFFNLPVSEWESNDAYQRGKNIVDHLKVINDHAERRVQLVQNFNGAVTHKEQSFQDLLLNVEDHRKRLPNKKKCTLVNRYSV